MYCRISELVFNKVEVDICEIFKTSAREEGFNHILGTIAIQIGIANILKDIGLTPEYIIGFNIGKYAASYANNYFTLKDVIIEILDKADEPKYGKIAKDFSFLSKLDCNTEIMSNNIVHNSHLTKNLYNLSTDYKQINNLHQKDVICVIVGENSKALPGNSLLLTDYNSKNSIINFLNNLGR